MIRGIISLLAVFLVVSACATGKKVKSSQKYSQADFQVVDVNVNVPASVGAGGDLRRYMRNAATHLAHAYNENVPPVAPEFVLDIYVQSYKPSPASQATLAYDVVMRYPNDGTQFRALPVVYSNLGNSSSSPSSKGLIRGSLPEAFKHLYGKSSSPASVQRMLANDDIFGNPAVQQTVAPVTYDPPVNSAPETAGEPQVIACDVC